MRTRDNEQFVQITARCGSIYEYMVSTVNDMLEAVVGLQSSIEDIRFERDTSYTKNDRVYLRRAAFDDKHGGLLLYIDYLHHVTTEAIPDIEQIITDHFGSTTKDGLLLSIEVRVLQRNFLADGFFPLGVEYYG